MASKAVIVDARGALLGRLASRIAKELLNGQHVTVVRCEAINISGSLFRNQLKYKEFLRKRCVVNPERGAFHFRAPSKILWRTIRGMLPHKSPRGAAALGRFKAFDGVPPPYDKAKRFVLPETLRVTRLRPGRRFCVLGDLSTKFGWKYGDVVNTLEAKRKTRSAAWYAKRKADQKLRTKAIETANKKISPEANTLLQSV